MPKLIHNLLIALLIITGLSIIFLTLFYFFNYQDQIPQTALIIISSLLLFDGIIYFSIAYGIIKKIKIFYHFGILLNFLNAIAIIFDNIGLYDIIATIVSLIILILLIIDYKNNKGVL